MQPLQPAAHVLLRLVLAAGTSSMSGVVYITDESHKQLLDEAYCMFSWTNPLHADVFPSVRRSCTVVGQLPGHCFARINSAHHALVPTPSAW